MSWLSSRPAYWFNAERGAVPDRDSRGGGPAAAARPVPGQGRSLARVGPAVLGALLALLAAALTPAPALAATKTWSGRLFLDTNWTTPSNWVGGVAPVAGDDLVFPSNAVRFTSNNDFPPGTKFHSSTNASGGSTPNATRAVFPNATTGTPAPRAVP